MFEAIVGHSKLRISLQVVPKIQKVLESRAVCDQLYAYIERMTFRHEWPERFVARGVPLFDVT
jgi:hypothetical protein